MSALAIEELLQPIAETRDWGADHPSHDELRIKIREIRLHVAREGGPHASEQRQIVQLTSDALQFHVKDLQLAVWLTDALIQLDGFAGLRDGLTIILRLIENFWDDLYPGLSDLETRAARLTWLGTDPRLARDSCPVPSLRLVPLTSTGLTWMNYNETTAPAKSESEREAVKAAKDAFSRAIIDTPKEFFKLQVAALTDALELAAKLSEACDSRFGTSAPSFEGLRTTLEKIHNAARILLLRKLEREPDPAAPAAITPAAVQPLPQGAEPAGEVAHARELTSREQAYAAIISAAHALRRMDPSHPAPYLVLRSLRWGELRSAGKELSTDVFRAPDSELRTRLRHLASSGSWQELLEASENAAASEYGRAWLDVHRYAVEACEQLGYEAAALAIRSGVASLLNGYPKLASATLPDDTGAANPETAAWLADLRDGR